MAKSQNRRLRKATYGFMGSDPKRYGHCVEELSRLQFLKYREKSE